MKSYNNRKNTIEKIIPLPPQGQSGFQPSHFLQPSWLFPAHGCSFQSHQSVQSDLRSPLKGKYKK